MPTKLGVKYKNKKREDGEADLDRVLKEAEFPEWVPSGFWDYPDSQREADWYWPQYKVAVELDGATWKKNKDGSWGGRHNHPTHTEAEYDKMNAMALKGILLLKFTTVRAKQDEIGVVETIRKALVMRGCSELDRNRILDQLFDGSLDVSNEFES